MRKTKSPTKPKKIARGLLFGLLGLALVSLVIPASAFQEDGPRETEVSLDFGDVVDVSIGNGGISMDESKMRGTMFLSSEEWGIKQGWHIFTQNILDFKVVDLNGNPFQWVYGNVRVYFNLDGFQYNKWTDETSNMGIWYYDKVVGYWKKCHTWWEPAKSSDQGRLWCLAKHYTRYGIGYTQPTMLMKFIKLGLITLTPTPSVTPTPTKTPTP